MDDSRSTEYCSGPFYLYCSCPIPVPDKFQDPAKRTSSRIQPSGQVPGSSQADKFPDPAKLTSSRFQQSSSKSGPRSRGLAAGSGGWRLITVSRTVSRVPIVNPSPAKTVQSRFLSSSRTQPSRSKSGPRSRGLAAGSGGWRLITVSRTVSRVPTVNLSPVKTIQVQFQSVQFLSSSRIHAESDHIDPTQKH